MNCADPCGGTSAVATRNAFCVAPGTPNFFDSPGPVAFLRLQPGGAVPRHVGTTNLRRKCHLALQVPAGGHSGAWVEVGGSSADSDADAVIRWEGAGQVEAFDDSFVHTVGNDASSSGGERTVLEVSFWHLGLRDWLVPPSATARRQMILSRTAAAAAAAASDSLFNRDGSAAFQRVEIYYNRAWNRGELVESYAVGEEIHSSGSGSVDLDVYVRYDRSQRDLQCSDEWLVLDCAGMRWRQPGFSGGGFRLLKP